MQRKSPQQFWMLCMSLVCLMACSRKATEEPDAGAMPPDDMTPDDMMMEPVGGQNGSTGGTGAAGGSKPTTMTGDASVPVDMPLPDFEGIDTDAIPIGKAPVNCTEKGTNDGTTLVLPLNAMIKGVLLTGKDGALLVNGIKCTSIPAPTAIKITGTTALETAIIDFSIGELPASLNGATISVDLGTGTAKDTFALATTREEDQIHLGMKDGGAVVSWGDERPNFKLTNTEIALISSGPGTDLIDATGGGDFGTPLTLALTVYAGAESDAIQGGIGNDALHGGEGDDAFRTAATADGGDVYDGGPGTDSLSYENRTNAITIKMNRLADDGETNEKDDVQDSIETIIGGAGSDTINGGDGDNTIVGGPGNDILAGGGGDDMFVETDMQQGSDIVNGGAGSDTIDYSERPTKLEVTLCIPMQASCNLGVCGCLADDGEANERDAMVNIENIYGGRGDDLLVGSVADNLFVGNEGNDDLRGESGDDTFYAGDGNDKMSGGAGDDLLSGDNGLDTFDGGDGQGDICIVTMSENPLNCELK